MKISALNLAEQDRVINRSFFIGSGRAQVRDCFCGMEAANIGGTMTALEKNTNQLYRQKYFVDERQVIRYRPPSAAPGMVRPSTVISARAAQVSPIRVPMNGEPPKQDAQIAVQLVRNGAALSGIRITCPCGRHAEVEMDTSAGAPGKGKAGL